MEKDEILQKVSKKKTVVGEMEKEKLGKCTLTSLVATFVAAVGFIVAEAALNHASAAFAIAALCYLWAGVFYTLQYFIAKRPWPVLIGAILHCLACIFFVVRYILCVCGVW